MWRFSSLRWRLTFFYGGLMLLLVLALGIFVYLQLDGFLTDSSATRLSYQLAPKLNLGPALVKKADSPATGAAAQSETTNAANLQLLSNQVQTLVTDTIYAATYNSTGRLVTPTESAVNISNNGLQPDFSWLITPTSSQFDLAKSVNNYHYVVDNGAGGRIVVLLIPVTQSQLESPHPGAPAPPEKDKTPQPAGPTSEGTPTALSTNSAGSVRGYVLIAQPLMEADRILNQLRLILLLGSLGAIFLIVLFGLPFARLGLAPLHKMTVTARQIASGDLSRRVELKPKTKSSTGYRNRSLKKIEETGSPDKENQDEVRQLAVAFNQMLDRIEAAFKAQRQSEARTRQFVADASHELRTPLTTLGGSVDVLLMQTQKEPLSQPQMQTRKLLNTMHREIERLSRLVVNLLQLTRLDSNGKQAILLEPVRLEKLVEDVCDELKMLAGSRQLRFENLCSLPATKASVSSNDEYICGWVEADSDRLRQVLTNLIDNAIRYTAEDGQIVLRLQPSIPVEDKGESKTRRVKLEVIDNGSGIAADHLPHIFDRFYRADEARASTSSNAGLGLSIVKAIVEAHGGQIKVESRLGEGTTFTIWLSDFSTTPGLEAII